MEKDAAHLLYPASIALFFILAFDIIVQALDHLRDHTCISVHIYTYVSPSYSRLHHHTRYKMKL